MTTIYQSKSNDKKYEPNRNEVMHSCNESWAGDGYYFWDSHIKLAQWWGKKYYKNKYLIAQANINIDIKCFDIHNSYQNQITIAQLWIKLKGKIPSGNANLPSFFQFLRDIGIFGEYDAIRFCITNSVGKSRSSKVGRKRINVKEHETKIDQYLDLIPPIQICLFTEKSLGINNYKIIFDSK